jgi:hypothetical protein
MITWCFEDKPKKKKKAFLTDGLVTVPFLALVLMCEFILKYFSSFFHQKCKILQDLNVCVISEFIC